MSLIRYNRRMPATSKSLFDQFFHDFGDLFPTTNAVPRASVNVKESDTAFSLELLAPGFSKDEITISLDNDVLTVRGEKKVENKEQKENYTRKEFSFSSFERRFELPDNADQDNITANFENGILNLSLAKVVKEEKNGKKVIEIG